jgi:hypothetical protein
MKHLKLKRALRGFRLVTVVVHVLVNVNVNVPEHEAMSRLGTA